MKCGIFLLFLSLLVADALAGSCYVRINQIGFLPNEPKTGYVFSSSAVSGPTFTINHSGGSSAYSGKVSTTAQPSWPGWYTYAFSFDSVQTTDIYTAQVSGCGVSPPFKILPTSDLLYRNYLANSLFYFQANRDGSDVNSSILDRKPSHLTDEQATVYKDPVYKNDKLQGSLSSLGLTYNVSGGWFDAGDYIKFVETTSYVVSMMGISVRDYPSILDAGDFLGEFKHGLQWLLSMWDNNNQILLLQVGIGDGNSGITGDHDIWRLPEADDALNVKPGDKQYFIKYRPVFANADAAKAAPISPNLAGRMSAALALGYQLFQTTDPSLAQNCLAAAGKIYSLAQVRSPPKQLVTCFPYDYYGEDEWFSDMELGATQLFRAATLAQQPATQYYTDAMNYAKQSINSGDGDTLNLYDVGGLAHYELYKISTSSTDQKTLVSGLKALVSSGASQAKKDTFGLGTTYDSDVTPETFGFYLMQSFYAEISGDKTTYLNFGQNQKNYAFGANPWGSSFVVGVGTTFPHCLQHQVANLVGSLDGTGAILFGAVPDGPSSPDNFDSLGLPGGANSCPSDGSDPFNRFTYAKKARYMDDARAWPSSEPAQDYTVISLMSFARLYHS